MRHLKVNGTGGRIRSIFPPEYQAVLSRMNGGDHSGVYAQLRTLELYNMWPEGGSFEVRYIRGPLLTHLDIRLVDGYSEGDVWLQEARCVDDMMNVLSVQELPSLISFRWSGEPGIALRSIRGTLSTSPRSRCSQYPIDSFGPARPAVAPLAAESGHHPTALLSPA